MKTKFEKEESELMSKDPSNWKWIFYYNPNDPRAIVPRRSPFSKWGWTLNFGNRYTWIGLSVIVLILIAFKFLANWF